ncbi:hypothetical protein BHE90_011422 [Fusarium euwallaceae]|uniref:Uncharacterized protein n=1 Tax=Fusarium euwallaceae TaxID=1147111 RepID=A0A430LEJ6_9HYPO|nr:hypothetical protein BHE90_011422 [Fusarium euwallaceae]
MLGLRAGTVLNFILGRQYAGIPQQIDVTESASLVERAPVVITETVMESLIVVVPKTTTVQVTYHVPINASTSATADPSATLPFASTAILNATSSTFDPAQDTPLFAINPSLILSESQESEPVPTTAAEGDALPGTSEAHETAAPIETATTEEASAEPTAEPTSEPISEPTSEQASEPIPEVTSEAVSTETPEEARLVSEQDSTSSEVLLFDTASLTFTGPPGRSTTLQTRSGTTTAASAPGSTQSSDGFTPDDSETGITDPRPSYTTATLPGGLITTIGLDATAGNDQASETDGAGVISKESNDTAATPVVVGSVVGSVMGLSMLVFLFWFLRRRATRRRRRSTLLTPLGIPPGAPGGMGGEKYEIDNHSLGPTPRSTKLAAAVTANAKKFGHRIRLSMNGSPGVNMNRGNSQFLDSNPSHSRSASVGPYPSSRGDSSQGQQGWWSRLILESSAENLEAQEILEKERGTTRTPSPNPFSDAHSMAAVPPANPFASARDSLMPSPLAPGRSPPQRPPRPDDPFSDSNSVAPLAPTHLPPATYVSDVRRSRGPSMARNLTPPGPNGSPNLAIPTSREGWRDNIHSNPFDLELDGRHVPSVSNIHPMPPRYTAASSFYGTQKRATTHSRAESFTSRYTSGVSMLDEWPVPPTDSRYSGAGYPYRHSRSESDSVLGRQSVGQAM